MAKVGRPRKENPSKRTLYMRNYVKKHKTKSCPKYDFWGKVVKGFGKFLEPSFRKVSK